MQMVFANYTFAKSRKEINEIYIYTYTYTHDKYVYIYVYTTRLPFAVSNNVPVASVSSFVIPDLERDKISIYKCPTAAISKTEGQINYSQPKEGGGCTVSGTLVLLASTRLLSMQMHESNKLLNTLRGIYHDRFSRFLRRSCEACNVCCVRYTYIYIHIYSLFKHTRWCAYQFISCDNVNRCPLMHR